MQQSRHVLAFAASTSKQSINGHLVGYAARLIQGGLLADTSVTTLDLNQYEMPIYSIDRERDGGIPDAARDFFARIGQADALLVSFAEHNGSYTAAYKNVFDWASRIQQRVYQEKPTVMLATSIGRRGGANVLKTAIDSGPHFGNVVRGSFSIPSFRDSFDVKKGTLIDPKLDRRLRAELKKLENEGPKQ